jgi:ADP-ribosylglycohydrolase
MHGKDKDYIKENVLKQYYPSWYSRTYADIKPDYDFSETCQLTVPVAIICFLESEDYADCLKLAISLGGDADTLAAIAGPMAYAYYKEMPEDLIQHAKTKLSDWMLDLNDQFDTFVEGRK